MTILYADDDRDDCELLSETLSKINPEIECILANNGLHALNLLNKNDKLPDFIFLDINMPVMDGKKCLLELKQNSRLKEIPVVMYSTTSNPAEINTLYEYGASLYIQKPNNINQLYLKLNHFLTQVSSDGLQSAHQEKIFINEGY
jgi:CheY-like chemotaxis protein